MSRSKRHRQRRTNPKSPQRPRSTPRPPSSLYTLLALVTIVVAGFAAYHNCFQNPFVLDDGERILRNPFIRQFSADIFAHTSRPLVQLTLALNYAVSGLDVWSYHLFNVAAHVLAAWVLFVVVRRTLCLPSVPERFRDSANGIALSAALLWVVHPLQTQAVTYLIQRSEVIASLFYLLTLYAAMRAYASERPLQWTIVSIACCALGMASKPVMATAPFMVLVYDRVFLGDSWRGLWRRRSMLYVGLLATLAILPLLLARAPMDWQFSSGFGATGVSAAEYAATQPGVILHYLKQTLWPHPLVFDYAWPVARGASAIVVPTLVVGLLVGASLVFLVRGARLAFLGVWFFVILAPTSSFIPVLDLAFEHRVYLPLAAVTVLAALAGFELVRRIGATRILASALTLLLVVTLGMLTVRRNRDYTGVITLWTDTLAKRPANHRARVSLGFALDRAGQREQALEHFEMVLDQDESQPWARIGMGMMLEKFGRREESLVHLREAVRLMPASAEARFQLGTVLFRNRVADEAIVHLREAVRLEPGRAFAYNTLGAAYELKQEDEASAEAFAAAIRLKPGNVMLLSNLGFALGRLGRLDESRQQFLAVLQIEPGNQRALDALEELRRAAER